MTPNILLFEVCSSSSGVGCLKKQQLKIEAGGIRENMKSHKEDACKTAGRNIKMKKKCQQKNGIYFNGKLILVYL